MTANPRRFGLFFLFVFGSFSLLEAQPVAPSAERNRELRAMREADHPTAAVGETLGGFVVDPASREASRTFFRTVYTASEGVAIGWTGDYTSGDKGDTDQSYKDAVRRRINYFRAMAGIPADVTFNSTYSAKAQQAALMMSANDQLSHFPPNTWIYWTADGREAAENSNLAIGSSGPDSVVGYIQDHGVPGNAAVGHRRWLLYPQTEVMGTGDVPGIPNVSNRRPANSIWVFDGNFGGTRPAVRDSFVAWPPPGYVPYDLVFPRWSVSYPGANFNGATVSMKRNGVDIAVAKEILSSGVGETTLVWVYDGLDANVPQTHSRPGSDTTYAVVVDGVTINGQNQKWEYDVIVFDPDQAGGDYVATTVTGPATPVVAADNTYSVAMADFATGVQWRSLQSSGVTNLLEGAESGTATVDIVSTDGYEVIVSSPKVSGSKAFNLRHSGGNQTEYVRLKGTFLARGDSQFSMRQRLAAVTDDQTAAVQVSFNGGGSWNTIWEHKASAQNGTFSLETVSLSSFAGETFELRLVFSIAYGSWFNGSQVGWYFDDVELKNMEPVTTGAASSTIDGTGFTFRPSAAGSYALQARPVFYQDYPLDWGPVFPVTAEVGGSIAPAITSQPGNLTVNEGEAAQFSVVATGTPTPSFQWKKGNQELVGATASTLSFSSAGPDDAGSYTVVVSNEAGTVTSAEVILTVVSPPVITADPVAATVDIGGNVSFSVSIIGTAPFVYQWFKDNVEIDGATGATLQLSAVASDDAGSYSVQVTNGAGSDSSASAELTVNASPYGGAYFGTIGGNSGTFALWVRGSNSAILVIYLDSPGDGLVEHNLPIESNGSFSFDVPEGIGSISGQINGESVTGSISGLSLDLVGTRSDPDGPFAPSSGYFPLAVVGQSGGSLDVIVGADGRAMIFAPDEVEADSLTGVLNGGGALIGTSYYGVEVNLTFGPGSASGTFSGSTSGSGNLGGYREGVSAPHLLANISMRGNVGTGGGIMIAGFVVEGAGSKPILVRAVGPTLAGLNVSDTISDPQLSVLVLNGPVVGGNDNWEAFPDLIGLETVRARVGAFPLDAGANDSALALELGEGSFTAKVSGVDGVTGISLVEVYDTDDLAAGGVSTKLSNISMRGSVGTGNRIMIAGFVIEPGYDGDPGVPKQVLIRGVGPSLLRYGLQGAIVDPLLRLFNSANEPIAENDNWEDADDLEGLNAAMAAVGAFDLDDGSTDSALLIWLLPGLYTAKVSGVADITGLALVEVYAVP